MKYYKLLLLLLGLFFITGCGMDYQINIDNGVITEQASVLLSDKEVGNNSIYDAVDQLIIKYDPLHNWLITYETKEVVGNPNRLELKSKYDFASYEESLLFGLCYTSSYIAEIKDRVDIATTSKFNCFDQFSELDEVNVQLRTNHKVYSSNADSEKNGVYTWKITKGNQDNKPIRISLSREKEVVKNQNMVYYVVIGIIGVVLLIVLIVRRLMKKRNEF